jgi:hypothetical protein
VDVRFADAPTSGAPLWARIEPLLPVVPRRADHAGGGDWTIAWCCVGPCLCSIRGFPGEFLPQELGFGSRMTCWRRLRDWNDACRVLGSLLHGCYMARLLADNLGLCGIVFRDRELPVEITFSHDGLKLFFSFDVESKAGRH